MQDVVIRLPDPIMRRAEQAAEVLQKPVDQLLATLVTAALPDLEHVPAQLQPKLARMAWLGEQELWSIACSVMTSRQTARLRKLSQLEEEGRLTVEEQAELADLRQLYGEITLLKARAYALLSLRGGLPLLTDS